MIREAIVELTARHNLKAEMAEQAMDEIMNGKASHVEMCAFLVALAVKNADVEEITACAKGMRKNGQKIHVGRETMEIVGTGGDKSNSFNISTISSIVLAAAGVPMTKHGNRAATSKCGAADVLEALGVKIDTPAEKTMEILQETDFCFLFAQLYHSSMRHVAPVRKELPVATVFNILGPLTNPAEASMQLMGVYSEHLVEPLTHVLYNLGVRKAMVVFGQEGLDEISASAPTTVCEVRDGEFTSYVITPEQFGMERCSKKDLEGGTPAENAAIARAILQGEKGPKRNAVLLNAGAALHIAKGISLEEGIQEAAELIDSGKAMEKLEQIVAASNR